MESTVCPIRLVTPDIEAVVHWFYRAARWDSWSGQPIGIRDWPRPGGLMRQDARLVQAVDVLLAEMQYLPKARAPKERRREEPEEPRRPARRSVRE